MTAFETPMLSKKVGRSEAMTAPQPIKKVCIA
jgi:hypothetical protein